MKPVLKNQFFKRLPAEGESDRRVQGWSVVVVKGRSGAREGDTQPPPARVGVIRNDTRTAKIVWLSYERVSALVDSDEWIETVAPRKPWVELEPPPPKGTPTTSESEEARNARNKKVEEEEKRRMNIIQPILDLGDDQFDERIRAPLQERLAKKHHITPECVWQYLCLYWQLGQRPKAVRPRHHLAGQKSLAERMAEHEAAMKDYIERQSTGNLQPGELPPVFHVYKTGPKPSAPPEQELKMDDKHIKRCRRGADRHLFKLSPDHKLRLKWDHAHTETLIDFYDRDKNPNSPAPTIDQFITAVKSDPEFKRKQAKIVGVSMMATDHRQLTRTSYDDLEGPGQLGYFDDAHTKVILVDEVRHLPIGTGRFFALIDPWSGIIAGAHDTILSSNYSEAAECLVNAFLPKTPFDAHHQLGLKLQYFPCEGVFHSIQPDNGPLGGALADIIPEKICEVLNPPSRRPDWKPDVESSFNAYLTQHAEKMPGYNRVKRCGGKDDPKVTAYLTPREFRRLLWKWLEVFNRRKRRGWLCRAVMAAEDVPGPQPYQLWNHGIIEHTGFLQRIPEDELRKELMPRGTGTMSSRRGITFRTLPYFLEETEGLETDGFLKPKPVNIRYHSNYVGQIFVEYDGKQVVARLRADLYEDYGQMTFAEMERIKKWYAPKGIWTRRDHKQAKVELAADRRASEKRSKEAAAGVFGLEEIRQNVAKFTSIDANREVVSTQERRSRGQRASALFNKAGKNSSGRKHDKTAKPHFQPTALQILENN